MLDYDVQGRMHVVMLSVFQFNFNIDLILPGRPFGVHNNRSAEVIGINIEVVAIERIHHFACGFVHEIHPDLFHIHVSAYLDIDVDLVVCGKYTLVFRTVYRPGRAKIGVGDHERNVLLIVSQCIAGFISYVNCEMVFAGYCRVWNDPIIINKSVAGAGEIKNALVYSAYRQTPASERIQAVRLTSGEPAGRICR
jgi:hypothetical protein